MAFTVTPTSGAAPYVYTASFADQGSFSTGIYTLGFASTTIVGSCPLGVFLNNNQPNIASALLANGTYTEVSSSVPVGSCRRYALFIRDTRDNSIVQEANFNIDNV